jgi:hypothetical protein
MARRVVAIRTAMLIERGPRDFDRPPNRGGHAAAMVQ